MTSTSALPGTTILNLPIATTLDGSEYVPIVQGGTTKRTATGNITTIFSTPSGFVSGVAGQVAVYTSSNAIGGSQYINASAGFVTLGLASSATGRLILASSAGGATSILPTTATVSLTAPITTTTLVGDNTTNTLTNKTMGAFTIAGTVSGGGNQINNVIIGTSQPLAGTFTTITSSVHNSTSAIIFQSGGGIQAGLISSAQKWVVGPTTITAFSSGQIFTVSRNTATTLPSTQVATSALPTMVLASEDNSATNMMIMCFGSSASALAGVRYLQSRGTAAAPSQLVASDGVFANFGYGYGSDGTYHAVTGFVGTALDSYSSTALGARLDLYATPAGGTAFGIMASVGAALMVGTQTDGSVGQIIMNSSTFLMRTKTAWANGAGAGVGTLLNAPTSSNPTKWIPIDDNGTVRYLPAW